MKAIAVVLLALLAGCASMQEQEQPRTLVATFAAVNTAAALFDEPCTNEAVLKAIPPTHRAKAKAARGHYEGKEYGVCWLWNDPGTAAVIVWDDGGGFQVPKHMLKMALEV